MAKITEETRELLVKQILDQIINDNSENNRELKSNISVRGRSRDHMIDIYWKFEKEGQIYSFIVKVSDSSHSVDQETMIQFKSDIDDLADQFGDDLKGIYISAYGFKEEARGYAQQNGVLCYELLPPEADGQNLIKNYNITIEAYTPRFDNIKFIQDVKWNLQELKKLNISPNDASAIRVEVSDELKFLDENGNEITTAFLLFNSLVPKGFSEISPTKITYKFDKPTFIQTSNTSVKMKILAVEAMISKIQTIQKRTLKAENFVDYVLRNAESTTGIANIERA